MTAPIGATTTHDGERGSTGAVTRRDFLSRISALIAAAAIPLGAFDAVAAPLHGPTASSPPHQPRNHAMKMVCIIRYEIDPYQRAAFREYAANWGRIIPRCGGQLLGYFLPWQGTNYVGWGLIAFDGLAAYATYQAQLREDPDGRKNFAFAQAKRFILKEERNFVEVVDGTFEIPAVAT